MNFTYNTLGLYLTKAASSTVNAIVSSLLLPITTLAFTLPILGEFREAIKRETFIGLGVIVLGFILYQYGSSSSSRSRKKEIAPSEENLALLDTPSRAMKSGAMKSPKPIATFQERIVGVMIKHGVKEADGFNGCIGGDGGYIDGGYTRYGSLEEKRGGSGFKRVNSFDSRFASSI